MERLGPISGTIKHAGRRSVKPGKLGGGVLTKTGEVAPVQPGSPRIREPGGAEEIYSAAGRRPQEAGTLAQMERSGNGRPPESPERPPDAVETAPEGPARREGQKEVC